MARQFDNFYSHGAINFSDFINCVSSLYTGPDCLDDSTLRLLAEMLYRLSQNKQFLAAQVAGSSNYQHHSRGMLDNDDLYVLYENKRPFFKVCAQIWHPMPKRGTQRCFIPQVRDYNFTALTTNYFGPVVAASCINMNIGRTYSKASIVIYSLGSFINLPLNLYSLQKRREM